jgi:predicted DNA-binding protein with PD1-like motif
MHIIEPRRARKVLVRLDRGDELPGALLRALDQLEVKAGWVTAVGSVEAAELFVGEAARSVAVPAEVVSLAGSLAQEEGESVLRVSCVLAADSAFGPALAAGRLVWARADTLDVCIDAFEDVALARAPDPRTGARALTPTAPGVLDAARLEAKADPSPSDPQRAEPPRRADPGAPVPAKIARRVDEPDLYPEPGDQVVHFHFGECEVILSDGDRIRLRQLKDGRVREVALSMLRIDPPAVDPATGKRTFPLLRKN